MSGFNSRATIKAPFLEDWKLPSSNVAQRRATEKGSTSFHPMNEVIARQRETFRLATSTKAEVLRYPASTKATAKLTPIRRTTFPNTADVKHENAAERLRLASAEIVQRLPRAAKVTAGNQTNNSSRVRTPVAVRAAVAAAAAASSAKLKEQQQQQEPRKVESKKREVSFLTPIPTPEVLLVGAPRSTSLGRKTNYTTTAAAKATYKRNNSTFGGSQTKSLYRRPSIEFSAAAPSASSKSITSANSKAITSANSKSITSANSKSITSANSKAITSANSKAITSANSKSITSANTKSITSASSKTPTSNGSMSKKPKPILKQRRTTIVDSKTLAKKSIVLPQGAIAEKTQAALHEIRKRYASSEQEIKDLDSKQGSMRNFVVEPSSKQKRGGRLSWMHKLIGRK